MISLDNAIQIAVKVHQGQVDKAGHPYILHPLRVMLKLDGEYLQILGVLHDVLEDSKGLSFGLNQLQEDLERLTRREGETYQNYLYRVSETEDTILVKLADLEDNMDSNRPRFGGKDQLMNRYGKAIDFLRGVLDEDFRA